MKTGEQTISLPPRARVIHYLRQALAAGVDYMVIGRPVTQSANPAETLKAINASLNKGA